MLWPTSPSKTHPTDPNSPFTYDTVERKYRAPREGESHRTCDYCGSIHPEDLHKGLMELEWRLGGSDWKYGWPHKFYVYGPKNEMIGKFYNEHLKEVEDAETLKVFTHVLHAHTGIHFKVNDGSLQYSAPHRGYQR